MGSSFSLKTVVHRRCARTHWDEPYWDGPYWDEPSLWDGRCLRRRHGGGGAKCPALKRMKRPPHMSWRWPLHRMERLSAQTEALDQLAVASDVGGLEVAQHALATTDQQQQTPAAVVIVLVLTRVLGKVQDAAREHRDLDLGGTGVALFGGVLGHDLLLDSTIQGHAVSPRLFRCAVPWLSLIHISEPTSLGMISYAV